MALDEATGEKIKVDIEVPRWDQSTYWGRATHFFTTANPINVFATPAQLDQAKDIVTKYRKVTFNISRHLKLMILKETRNTYSIRHCKLYSIF